MMQTAHSSLANLDMCDWRCTAPSAVRGPPVTLDLDLPFRHLGFVIQESTASAMKSVGLSGAPCFTPALGPPAIPLILAPPPEVRQSAKSEVEAR